MKKIIILRHAKSDWSNLYLPDFERELNDRGLIDAPLMGLKFLKRNIPIELILSSSAKRAAQTGAAKGVANSGSRDLISGSSSSPSLPLEVEMVEEAAPADTVRRLRSELTFMYELCLVVASNSELPPILDWVVQKTTSMLSAGGTSTE